MPFQLNNDSTALILSAGYGSRLKPITDHIPKSLIDINGTPMLTRICNQIYEAGIKRIAINIHYLFEPIEEFVSQLSSLFPTIKFHLSYEPKLLDVGGGIKKVASELNVKEILIFNCDAYIYGNTHPLEKIIHAFDVNQMDALLYLKDLRHESQEQLSGDFGLTSKSKLERSNDPNKNYYNYTGVSIFKTKPLINIESDEFHIMNDYMFPQLDKNHKFFGMLAPFQHIDIGTLPDLERARNLANSITV